MNQWMNECWLWCWLDIHEVVQLDALLITAFFCSHHTLVCAKNATGAAVTSVGQLSSPGQWVCVHPCLICYPYDHSFNDKWAFNTAHIIVVWARRARINVSIIRAEYVIFAPTLEKQHRSTLAAWDIRIDWSWCCAPPANQQTFIMSAKKFHAESWWAHYSKTLQSSDSSTNEILVLTHGHYSTTHENTLEYWSTRSIAGLGF